MRLRFAPSPTGALHIGGARTALYNWLLARNQGGALVLRIEDTDRERSTPENVEQILDALRWLELDWDEGPIFQSEQAARHGEALAQLLDAGRAYRTTATADDVKAYKQQHGADRGYRGQDEGEGAIRLRIPDDEVVVVDDIVHGPTEFRTVHMDDPVIARADGSVLYNFAVAIDDLDAAITHVVRGDDHLSNTPKQLFVLQALDAPTPRYAHLPLLHGPDGKKLSKRHGAASVQELRDQGYLPEAVRNYIALLGQGFGDDTILATDELVARFDLAQTSKSSAVFDEQKLRHVNGRHLHALPEDEIVERIETFTGRDGLAAGVAISAEKIQTLGEFWPLAGFLYDGPAEDPAAFEKTIGTPEGRAGLLAAAERLRALPEWTVDALESALRGTVEELGAKPRTVFQPVRVAIAGTTVSPGIWESLHVLGRDESLRRIDAALNHSSRLPIEGA